MKKTKQQQQNRRRPVTPQSERERILAAADKWRVAPDEACDACGAARVYHAPLCAESDPALITFWVSTCEKCLLDQKQAVVAYRNVRARGWARGGTADLEELASREHGSRVSA